MFLENTVNHKEQFGWIEVICGSMFSGKTEELIRRLRRAQFAQQKVEIFKPSIDVRYDEEMVVSHNKNEIRSTPVPAAANIASPVSSWPYSNTGNGNPATSTTAKSARPRSATIVLTRIDGGVIGTDFTLS